MRDLRFFPFAIVAVVTPAPNAHAEILGVGGSEQISLQAERLDIDIIAGEATLTGKVTLSRGDLIVNCPRVDLRFDHAPHVTWARGSGGVTADLRGVHAEAPSVEFDLGRQVLDLSGGVHVTGTVSAVALDAQATGIEIGRASCRERVYGLV